MERKGRETKQYWMNEWLHNNDAYNTEYTSLDYGVLDVVFNTK